MDLPTPTLWWIAAGVAVAAELATGTFYLLMIALGLAAGAVAAHLGVAISAQVILAALVGGGATAVWHWRRFRQPHSAPASENRDVNLDIGEQVVVRTWVDDRTTRVQYRGSTWTARLAPGSTARSGAHRVVAVEGNWLVLAPVSPQ
jgi:membrane protein implicated in regulation of membrane protease activity